MYAEFRLLSCEHKIFIVINISKRTEQSQMCRNEHCHCFFLPFCLWLWQYGFHFRSEATKLKGELKKKNGKTLILVLIPQGFWHYLWLCIWIFNSSFKHSWHSDYTSGSVSYIKGWFTQNNDASKRVQVILTITTQIITELSQWNLFVFFSFTYIFKLIFSIPNIIYIRLSLQTKLFLSLVS